MNQTFKELFYIFHNPVWERCPIHTKDPKFRTNFWVFSIKLTKNSSKFSHFSMNWTALSHIIVEI